MFAHTLICAAFAAVLMTTLAFGASQRDRQDCSQLQDIERTIHGCTQMINDRTEPQTNRGIAFLHRGIAWRKKGELDRAIADYNEAIRLNPKDDLAYSSRGSAWAAKGDLDRAIADFNEAIRLDPKDADTYLQRGLAWKEKGDLVRANADFDQAIKLDPKLKRPS